MGKFTSRKFLLALLAMLVSAWLVCIGRLESTAFVTVVVATVGAYIAGNVVQKSNEVKP